MIREVPPLVLLFLAVLTPDEASPEVGGVAGSEGESGTVDSSVEGPEFSCGKLSCRFLSASELGSTARSRTSFIPARTLTRPEMVSTLEASCD
jgi:hypothetical protein